MINFDNRLLTKIKNKKLYIVEYNRPYLIIVTLN